MRRPEPWHETFMAVARVVARRSKDPSFQAGAVLVGGGNVILAAGYNGPPAYSSDDFDWDDRGRKHLTVVHAESNCLWYATGAHGRGGVVGCTLFVNGRPCHRCTLEAVRAGLAAVVYDDAGPQPRMIDGDEWGRSLGVAADGGLRLIPLSSLSDDGSFREAKLG